MISIYIFYVAAVVAAAIPLTFLISGILALGMILSIFIAFLPRPLFNTYVWIRDLFCSDKIKNQNKHYDHFHKILLELNQLAAEKNDLSKEISIKLNNAIKCFSPKLFAQGNLDFEQLSLNDQIQVLEQEKQNHPAHSRKQKNKETWNKIFRYSAKISFVGLALYGLILVLFLMGPTTVMVLAPISVLFTLENIFALIMVGPIALNSFVYATYLGMRDLFSSAEIKAENKQYAQLEKTISGLKKLGEKANQLDEKINSKFKEVDENLTPTLLEEKAAENFIDSGKDFHSNNKLKYGPMFTYREQNPVITPTALSQELKLS